MSQNRGRAQDRSCLAFSFSIKFLSKCLLQTQLPVKSFKLHLTLNICSPQATAGTRKSQTAKAASTPVKYCSDRCRHNKPSQTPGSTDRRIQDAFIALLDGLDPSLGTSQDSLASSELPPSKAAKGNTKKAKGETRITVSCAEVEAFIFGLRDDPEKASGRGKNRAPRGMPEPKEWKSVDMEDKEDRPDSKHERLVYNSNQYTQISDSVDAFVQTPERTP